jgi:transketolase C-terminal domain/subunit
MAFVGIRDRYAESGKPQELLERHNLMPADIARAAHRVLGARSERLSRRGG